MPDILPGQGDRQERRSFFDSLPRTRREFRWRWVGLLAILVGLFLLRHGQAPTAEAKGNVLFAVTGLLLALSGCVVTLLSFRRR